jgi:hypothetical protein
MLKVLLEALPIALVVAVCGCSSVPLTTSKEPMATDFALKRARFEMNCPEAAATVLSKQTIDPPMTALRFGAVERAEFTIGVAGCGKRETYVVVCADGADGCFAADARR